VALGFPGRWWCLDEPLIASAKFGVKLGLVENFQELGQLHDLVKCAEKNGIQCLRPS
jgi:hypothetical protein